MKEKRFILPLRDQKRNKVKTSFSQAFVVGKMYKIEEKIGLHIARKLKLLSVEFYSYLDNQNKCSMKCHKSCVKKVSVVVSFIKIIFLHVTRLLCYMQTTTETFLSKIYDISWNTYFGNRGALIFSEI